MISLNICVNMMLDLSHSTHREIKSQKILAEEISSHVDTKHLIIKEATNKKNNKKNEKI